jgi:hypothetical protein
MVEHRFTPALREYQGGRPGCSSLSDLDLSFEIDDFAANSSAALDRVEEFQSGFRAMAGVVGDVIEGEHGSLNVHRAGSRVD